MSLRFDRKGSRVRSSFSCKSRTERERELMDQQQYYMSWSYRQCQFACDYLNLMESPNSGLAPGGGGGVIGKANTLSLGKRKPLPPPRNSTTSLVSTVSSSGASSLSSCSSRSSVSSASENNYADLIDIGFPFSSHRDLDTRPVDPFRFSQATLEDTQEDELNAILGELSALQMSLDREIKQPNLLQVPGGGNETKSTGNTIVSNDNGVRTESPDNDSGFSDNASLLSSGSSLSASGSSSGSSTTSCGLKNNIPPSSVLHANEDEKAEKIRVALAKMRAASVTRLYVKAFSKDGSSKALMVEESMSCGRVLALLADKNHVPLSQKWALVEHIPHLHMERIYEDHENMVENLLMWTRDSKNKIYFVEREEKYDMFNNPQRYFLETSMAHGGVCMDEHTKNGLIEEFFNHGVGVPEVESLLYLKAEGKKAWKKFPFVLRASGIYYYPKGRNHANSSKDLLCLATIDHNQQAYQGIGWKKKFKSPTEFGFVLKPARLQVKSHRHMKYLCAEDHETLRLWMVGLRIAKYGKQMWDNYRSLMEDLAHEDLDRFGRSVSLASMPQQITGQMVKNESPAKIMPIRQFSQESMQVPNNIHSENSIEHSMPLPPPPPREEGFESDCPVGGTIKRKPSTVLTPKIPLTMNTRSIVGDYINVNVSSPGEGSIVTLQRKRSLSGNSSTSSNSSISSQIQMQSPPPLPTATPVRMQSGLAGKPPLSLSTPIRINGGGAKPATLTEESGEVVDYESLPPPPPELLMGEAETPTTPVCPPPPPPPPALSPLSGTVVNCGPYNSNSSANSIYSTSSSLKSSLAQKSSTLPTKKGVSFATELSERLKSRADNNNSSSPLNPVGQSHSLNRTTSNLKTSSINNFNSPPPPPSPKKLDDPPQDFLSDLQRVMQKKWQVAQKCSTDRNTNPHEILGFRLDPLAPPNSELVSVPSPEVGLNNQVESNNSEQPNNPQQQQQATTTANSLNNVRAWVSQHYGNSADELPPLNNGRPPPAPQSPKTRPPPPQRPLTNNYAVPGQIPNNPNRDSTNSNNSSIMSVANNMQNQQGLVIYENFQGRKSSQIHNQYDAVQLRNKKPPPPIPKRADSTHLSAHIVFN